MPYHFCAVCLNIFYPGIVSKIFVVQTSEYIFYVTSNKHFKNAVLLFPPLSFLFRFPLLETPSLVTHCVSRTDPSSPSQIGNITLMGKKKKKKGKLKRNTSFSLNVTRVCFLFQEIQFWWLLYKGQVRSILDWLGFACLNLTLPG